MGFLKTIKTFFENLGKGEISFSKPEKQYVIWEGPNTCPLDGTTLVVFSHFYGPWRICIKCGFVTLKTLIASESQLEEIKRKGFSVIREFTSCPV